jgi:two-component system copper resistance phosphate regulon response regulator CusR
MRILVIEDSHRLVESLRIGLTKAGFEVAAAGSGELGLRMALSSPWDVVILDLMLPGLSGHEVLRQIRAEGCEVHVLVLTALGAVEDRVRGLQAGADDYLGKPFSLDELVARLQALTRRKHGHKSPVIQVADLRIDTAGRTVTRNGACVSLTNREYRLLELLALREGQTVSRAELEEHLYGSRTLPLSNVVDSAICSIRSKLKLHGEGALIHTRPRLGYVLGAAAQ